MADLGCDPRSSDSLRGGVEKTQKLLTKFQCLATLGRYNSAVTTNAENSRPNGPNSGCLVSIFTVRINSKSFPGLYAAHQKGTYPNFRQSLIVTMDDLLSHGAKVNRLMWAWQLCDVASVNK